MLFRTKAVKPAISDVIQENIGSGSARMLLTESAGATLPEQATLSLPHDVYFIGLKALAQGKSLQAAVKTSTRVLVSDGASAVYAVAEVKEEKGGTSFLQLDTGPYVQPLVEGLAAFAKEQELVHLFHDLEIRLLRIPGLYIVALWLYNGREKDNLIIPIGRVPEELQASQVYAAGTFLDSIRDAAQKRLTDVQQSEDAN